MTKKAEAEITMHINPEEAETHAPAMGWKTNSACVIRGVPSNATGGMFIKTLARANPTWLGWTVTPRKCLTGQTSMQAMWLVDAAVEPPVRTIERSDHIIDIEPYIENVCQKQKGECAAQH